jgi:Arc/MetJ family transcription regulator
MRIMEVHMRTSVVIDEHLMARALKLGGYRTKKSAIEAGLRLLVQMAAQRRLRSLRGKIRWEGNLEEVRRDCDGTSNVQ